MFISIFSNQKKGSAEKLLISDCYYFQQDNDPQHKSHLIRERLLYNTPYVMETPPQTPDIN